VKTTDIPNRLDAIDAKQAMRGRPGPFYAELMAIARKLVKENDQLRKDVETAHTCSCCGNDIGGICTWCA